VRVSISWLQNRPEAYQALGIPKIHRQVYKGLIVKKNSIGEGKAALTDNLLGADTQGAHNPLMTKKSRNQ
jgi:hypothetical protein